MIDKKIPQGAHLDMSTGAKIKSLLPATLSGEAVEFDQLNQALLNKQDNVTGGNGIDMNGDTAAVSLVQPSSFSLVLSGLPNNLHNGTYALITTVGHFSGAGYERTFNTGTQGGESFYLFWNSTNRTVIGKDFTAWYVYTLDNSANSLLFEAALNSDSLVDGMEIEWTGPSDYDLVTGSNDVYNINYRVPADSDSNVEYVSGSGAYLEFEAGGLKASVTTDISSATTGELPDAGAIKLYVNDAKAYASVAGNNTFIDTVAQLGAGDVQAALETLAAENDSQGDILSDHTTDIADKDTKIVQTAAALGISVGSTDMGEFTNTILTDDVDLKTLLENFADTVEVDHTNLASVMGVSVDDTDMGAMSSTIFTDNLDAKAMLEEAGSAIEALQVGAGAFWTAVDYHHHADTQPLPVGWGDGSTDVGSFVIDPDGANLDISTMNTGDRILVLDAGIDSGIYIVHADNSTSRSTDANDDVEFTTNKTVNIINGGSHAGATYAYVGDDSPSLGVDVLVFEFKQGSNVGDATVTFSKLDSTVVNTINAKCDKYVEVLDIPDVGDVTVTHNLGSEDVIVQIYDSAKNLVSLDVQIAGVNSITVSSVYALTDAKVVVIG